MSSAFSPLVLRTSLVSSLTEVVGMHLGEVDERVKLTLRGDARLSVGVLRLVFPAGLFLLSDGGADRPDRCASHRGGRGSLGPSAPSISSAYVTYMPILPRKNCGSRDS